VNELTDDKIADEMAERLTAEQVNFFPHSNKVKHQYTDRLTLMVINESELFAYWDITERKKQMIESHFSSPWCKLTKALKISDITAIQFNSVNEHRSITLPTNDLTSLIVSDLGANRTYIADIGVTYGDNHFFAITRSKTVSTPQIPHDNHYNDDSWNNSQKNLDSEWINHFSTYSYYENIPKNPK
jgi:uncharacterized protein